MFKMAFSKGKENCIWKTLINMLEIFIKTYFMGKVYTFGKTGHSIKVSLKKENGKEMVN